MNEVIMKVTFKDDYITRPAGEKLRGMIVESVQKNEKLILNFEGLTIASTSFFDEGIAKIKENGVSEKEFAEFITIK
jgi:hypothetical protein